MWEHDIALLKLATPLVYTDRISPVCLPSQGINLATEGSSFYATGWGKTTGNGIPSEFLRQVLITAKKLSNCGAVSDNQICAGRSSPVGDSCSGDSGYD